ncbi:hypothetical protein ILP92_14385 [Maribius pontilimi]|uniref:histidine kinase n=1 Tax=Palleronia pontilimi TaxID=1964209 RepID=A0A934MAS0_9RHOB|nr:histidine kinase dimerization/phospho-acceptor domain-containing protein [Palleronia pontilimi]MBJ3763937.1 hypothetical protein [Palleronia pontilimi]
MLAPLMSLALIAAAIVGSGRLFAVCLAAAAIGSLMVLCARTGPLFLSTLAVLWAAGVGWSGFPDVSFAILSALPPLLLAAWALNVADRNRLQMSDQRQHQSERRMRLAHDLRTPLNGVNGAFEMLARRDLDGRAQKYVDLGLASCADLAELIAKSECGDGTAPASPKRNPDQRRKARAFNLKLESSQSV